MKKLLVLLFVFSIFPFMTYAQVHLGLQAGANFGDVSLDPKQPGYETSIRTGFLFGGMVVYDFSPMLALQFEPAYVQKGAKSKYSETFGTETVGIEATLSADYFDLPVLLKASFGDGPVKPYLMAGASVAFLLGDAKMTLDKATYNGQDVTNMIPADEKEYTVKSKSTDFILDFGGGVTIPVKTVNIFIEAQYNLGLTDVNDEPDDVTKIKTTGIQVKAGVLFPL